MALPASRFPLSDISICLARVRLSKAAVAFNPQFVWVRVFMKCLSFGLVDDNRVIFMIFLEA